MNELLEAARNAGDELARLDEFLQELGHPTQYKTDDVLSALRTAIAAEEARRLPLGHAFEPHPQKHYCMHIVRLDLTPDDDRTYCGRTRAAHGPVLAQPEEAP